MRWLGDNPVILIALAILIVAAILKLGFMALRMLGTPLDDPDRANRETADVEPFDVRYRCIVCGVEIRLTRIGADDDSFEPPRHCREDMALVVEAEEREPGA